MTDRPLWRTSTRVLMHELLRREDHEAWRMLLVEMPVNMLLAEVVARGYSVMPPMAREDTALYDAQAQRWVGPLGKKWPPLADDDA